MLPRIFIETIGLPLLLTFCPSANAQEEILVPFEYEMEPAADPREDKVLLNFLQQMEFYDILATFEINHQLQEKIAELKRLSPPPLPDARQAFETLIEKRIQKLTDESAARLKKRLTPAWEAPPERGFFESVAETLFGWSRHEETREWQYNGGELSPQTHKRNQLHAIQSLVDTRQGRAWFLLMEVCGSPVSTYMDQVRYGACQALADLSSSFTIDKLIIIKQYFQQRKDQIAHQAGNRDRRGRLFPSSIEKRDRFDRYIQTIEKHILNYREPEKNGIDYDAYHWQQVFKGALIDLPRDILETFHYNIVSPPETSLPLKAISSLTGITRLGGGIPTNVYHAFYDIPDELRGITTYGKKGYFGGQLGARLANTAIIISLVPPTIKVASRLPAAARALGQTSAEVIFRGMNGAAALMENISLKQFLKNRWLDLTDRFHFVETIKTLPKLIGKISKSHGADAAIFVVLFHFGDDWIIPSLLIYYEQYAILPLATSVCLCATSLPTYLFFRSLVTSPAFRSFTLKSFAVSNTMALQGTLSVSLREP